MGAAYFYHLTRRPLEATLPVLVERALGQGWRVAIRGTDTKRMDWLDQKLWLNGDESFLPHGQSGGPHDSLQPVLLTTKPDVPNDAKCLMSVDGADVAPEEAKAFERVCVLFDGGDTAAVEHARGQWRNLTQAGVSAQYWSEEGGRWEKKAEA